MGGEGVAGSGGGCGELPLGRSGWGGFRLGKAGLD